MRETSKVLVILRDYDFFELLLSPQGGANEKFNFNGIWIFHFGEQHERGPKEERFSGSN